MGLIKTESVTKYPTPFPIKCGVCSHEVNITADTPLDPVAIDCEMVGVGRNISALGRVSIVDRCGDVLYDVMVQPDQEITDYRTRWSGIRPSDMRRAIPFECAKEQVERIIQDRVVVGHMVHNDFSVLHIKHPANLVRDTGRASHPKLLGGFRMKGAVGLKTLTMSLFGIKIQTSEHCSVEDARATMAIYRLVEDAWEFDFQQQLSRKKQPKSPPQSCASGSADYCLQLPSNSSPTCLAVNEFGKRSIGTVYQASGKASSSMLPLRRSSLVLPNAPIRRSNGSSTSLLDDYFWRD